MSDIKEKRPVGLISSYIMCGLALCMPFRVRVIFTFLLNFIYNNVLYTLKVIIAVINSYFVNILIFLVYFVIVGISSFFARFFRQDYISQNPNRNSYFLDKEQPDETSERLQRQY